MDRRHVLLGALAVSALSPSGRGRSRSEGDARDPNSSEMGDLVYLLKLDTLQKLYPVHHKVLDEVGGWR